MNVDYKVDTIKFENLLGQVTIPQFQRGQVWIPSKQKAFIRAILNGYPFGSLLLYRNEKSIDSKFSLIDGLQRYSTLKKFYDNPCSFVSVSDFCKEDIKKIVKLVKNSSIVIGVSEIESEIKTAINEEFSFNVSLTDMISCIIKRLPFVEVSGNETEIQLIIMQILSDLLAKLNVMDLPIPIVIYSGDFNKLPDIFENINTSGTKLTKYDIFAARWVNYILKVENMDILVAVENKYKKAAEDTDSEIEGYNENDIIIEKQINLFEFCFALGSILKDKFPTIFGTDVLKVGKSNEKEEVESVGFSLLALILNGSPKNVDGLYKILCCEDAINIEQLIDAIMYSTKVAQEIMSSFVTDFNGKYIGKYSEHQIISIIATVFKIKFEIIKTKIVEKENTKQLFKKVRANCPGRFLYDNITNYWGGGDGSRVADEIQKSIEYNRYLQRVSDEEWHIALGKWMEEQCLKPMKKRDRDSIIFINYLLKMGGYIPKPNEKLEIDFIIPKKRFVSELKEKSGLCAIGNLALIPEFENRSKNEKTLYEQVNEKISLYWLKDEVLEKLLYPKEDEISFIKSSTTFTHERYLTFIRDRHLYLQKKFIDLMKTL